VSESGLRVGIAGATGAVGGELLRLVAESDIPVASLRALASARSAGTTVPFGGTEVAVEELGDGALRDLDVVFFSCGAEQSRRFAPVAVERGAVVIDNSSAFRMEDGVPLVIPEVNPDAVDAHAGIIAVPNCTTIVFLMAVAPLHREAGLVRAVVSTYQAASGAGASALREYEEQVRAAADGRPLRSSVFSRVLHGNVIPHVDVLQDDGWTREERKLLDESRKILDDARVGVASTCVRVPVARAHSVSAALEFRTPLTPGRAREVLRSSPGIVVLDGGDPPDYPTPLDVSGRHEVAVGRIREDLTLPGALFLWAVGDQLLKGAAWNAVQIAELLIQRGLVL